MASESNVFLIINLGCEMLYVIEQRLKAQQISDEKAVQVMRDVTSVLLDPHFIERMVTGNEQLKSLITANHCKFILNDIACCSMMRLDEQSMMKLWDLMTMVFKWQLFTSKYPQHLLEITFRHLDGVGNLYPEMKKTILVDYTKNTILDFWNSQSELSQRNICATIKSWLECFNVKISVLIRLGFQGQDGIFVKDPKEMYFNEFAENTGCNIYNKSTEIAKKERRLETQASSAMANAVTRDSLDQFANQLNVVYTESNDDEKRRNILFDDFVFDLNESHHTAEKPAGSSTKRSTQDTHYGFVQLKTSHNTSSTLTWEDVVINRNPTTAFVKDFKNLLNKKN